MAAVTFQIGTNSGSLTTMNKSPNELKVSFQETNKNKTTWHGNRNYAVLGQRKRVFVAKFVEVSDTDYAAFSNYAMSAARYWVRISGYSTTYIFNGYAYLQFAEVEVSRVTSNSIQYDFRLLIFQV